jgi:DNA-binding transcriptional LysR family regulator
VLVPTFIVSRDLLAGRLITVDLGAEVESISVSAVYPAANAGLPRLQALIDHLRKALGDPPSWDLALADAGLIQL